MGCFAWISSRALPPRLDLRALGWRLAADDLPGPDCALLIDGVAAASASRPALRPRSCVVGVEDSAGRARLLAAGFADALPEGLEAEELALRLRRLPLRDADPCRRARGRLQLDLEERDARIDGQRLHLHPREFALLWRLAGDNGAPVDRATLYRDVFGLGFDPGTNRLAVHVCRLRKKLAEAGLAHLLVTGPASAGYALMIDEGRAPPAAFGRRNGLDGTGGLREHPCPTLQEAAT
jgi:two-component system, OmpR family, response regulator